MKKIVTLIILCWGANASAEWYRVNGVPEYNKIRATSIDGENDPLIIRIRNLEKIEYIQSDPEKVLLGGSDALSLSKEILQGQVVWVENLQPESGEYVADIYPSFEQVVHVYKNKRLLNGSNIAPDTLKKLKIIYAEMMKDINQQPALTSSADQKVSEEIQKQIQALYTQVLYTIQTATPKGKSAKVSKEDKESRDYADPFQRALFIADAISWFRDKGQFMQPVAQEAFVDMLQSFQSEPDNVARYTQTKINKMMNQPLFFKDLFINQAVFERGKFTYTCLDWFKKQGQYLPQDIQNTFVDWLRIYQKTSGNEADFLKARLSWMMNNSGLYQDFLDQ